MSRPVVVIAAAVALAACSSDTQRNEVVHSASVSVPDTSVPVRDSSSGETAMLPQNHMGRIPVLEYHLLADSDARWARSPESFRKDLELLYARGYRPVTVSQMVDRDFSDVPRGMSPVVFTFDDASPGQFRYIERDGKLEIDPESTIGIWMDFASEHPDWKGRATFCLLNGGDAGHNFFGDKPKYAGQKNAWRFPKVKWLAENGFELCNHTLWHAQLSKYSDAFVQEQIARNSMGIDSAVAGYRVRTFALPQGLWPKNRELAWKGEWKDPASGRVVRYDFDAVLEVAGGPERSPYDPEFDAKSIKRVQVYSDELKTILDRLDRSSSRFVN